MWIVIMSQIRRAYQELACRATQDLCASKQDLCEKQQKAHAIGHPDLGAVSKHKDGPTGVLKRPRRPLEVCAKSCH